MGVTQEERLAAEQLEKQKCVNDADRKKKAAKIAAALKPKPPLDISGKVVFFEGGIAGAVAPYAERLGMPLAVSRATAQVFVTTNVGLTEKKDGGSTIPAGLRGIWTAMLRGGIVAQPEVLGSNGTRGTAIVYMPAVRTRRRLFISARFAACHAAFADIARDACTAAGSLWTFDPYFGKFVTGPKTGRTRIAIVTESEKRKDTAGRLPPSRPHTPRDLNHFKNRSLQDCQAVKCATTMFSFIHIVKKIGHVQTRMGLCRK